MSDETSRSRSREASYIIAVAVVIGVGLITSVLSQSASSHDVRRMVKVATDTSDRCHVPEVVNYIKEAIEDDKVSVYEMFVATHKCQNVVNQQYINKLREASNR